MKTMRLYTFVVREDFDKYKKGEKFEASVRTHVLNNVEVQDFSFPDGRELQSIPCAFTKFVN